MDKRPVGMGLDGDVRSRWYVCVMVALGVFFALWVRAEEPPFRFDVKAEAGFDGLFVTDHWAPLRVFITNHDGFVGPVFVRVDNETGCGPGHGQPLRRFRASAYLDGAPETSLLMGIRPSYATNKLWLHLIDGRSEAEGAIAPRQLSSDACATGQCPLSPYANQPQSERYLHSASLTDVLRGKKRRWESFMIVANASPELREVMGTRTLPHDKGTVNVAFVDESLLQENPNLYESASAIILDAMPATTVPEGKAEALRDWTISGGTLLLTRSCLESPWGEALLRQLSLDARVSGGATPADWAGAAGFFGVHPERTQPIEALPLRLGKTFKAIRGGGETPLLASHRVGFGSVVLVPFHTGDVRGTSGSDRHTQELVWGRALEHMTQRPGAWWPQSTVPDEMSIRSLALPYLLFVALSALCLGPLVTLLTFPRKRRIHALWLLPVVAVALCGVAFAVAYIFRGNASGLESVAFLYGDANRPQGIARNYLGLISGAQDAYELGPFPADTVIKENIEGLLSESDYVGFFPALVDMGSDGMALRELHMNRWSMRFFKVDRPAPIPLLSGVLRVQDNRMTGWVRNDSGFTVTHATLLFKWSRASLGTLAPGARADIDMPLIEAPETVRVFSPFFASFTQVSCPLNAYHWPDIPFDDKAVQLLRSYRVLDAPTLVGTLPEEADTTTPRVRVNGADGRARLVVGVWQLPVEIAPPNSAALTAATSVARDAQDNQWSSIEYCYQSPRSFRFAFPYTEASFVNPEIVLHTRLPAGGSREMTERDTLNLRFFDWRELAYSEAMTVTPGDMVIPDAARFLRPGDNTILFTMNIAGPLADSYGMLELDRLECSVREVMP